MFKRLRTELTVKNISERDLAEVTRAIISPLEQCLRERYAESTSIGLADLKAFTKSTGVFSEDEITGLSCDIIIRDTKADNWVDLVADIGLTLLGSFKARFNHDVSVNLTRHRYGG